MVRPGTQILISPEATQYDDERMECPLAYRHGERCDARRFDVLVDAVMVRAEMLVVRPVPGLERVVVRHDDAGASMSRPTRLDACMYSDVVFGCPMIVIRLNRGTSSPT